jgi:hypothetical protein
MDNEQRTSRFQCKKHFVSINKNLNRFCTDILFSALYTGYKISIYLFIFEHADIREIVEFMNGFEEKIRLSFDFALLYTISKRFSHWCWRSLARSPCSLVRRLTATRLTSRLRLL